MILITPKATVLTVQSIKISNTKGDVGLSLTKINLTPNEKKEVTKC
jgi:hypothetical protein